jgi:thiamine kinase-like enzyme
VADPHERGSRVPGPAERTAATLDDETIEALLDRIPAVAGRPREVSRLPGGLTNVNVRVTTPAGAVVARIATADSALLAIDRDAEHANSAAAAASGAAPAVVAYDRDLAILVVAFVEGRALEPGDLTDAETLRRIARACRTLHAGPGFVGEFDMVAVQRRYLDLVRAKGFRLPPGYFDHLPQVDRIAQALAVRAPARVPCNNDLLPANFVDDGSRIWVIDYEYAGMNDPCFELGNIWSEASLAPEHLETLVGAYYGRPLRHMVARARLFGLLSQYGWTVWASIQAASSAVDFDFWGCGLEKYERAEAEFASPAYETLLAQATMPA